MAQTMTRAQQILANRNAAKTAAKTTGKTPVNKPAQVEPAVQRRKIEALKPKAQAPEITDDLDVEEDDEPVVQYKTVRNKKTGKTRRVPIEATDAPLASTQAPSRAAVRALTVQNKARGGALALPMHDRTRQLDSRDTLIPRLKLSQAMSKVNTDDTVRQGNFYRSPDNKNLGKEIFAVVLDMRKSRSYFESGQGILCRSYDLIKGEGDPGILCEGTDEEQQFAAEDERGCPLRLWGERDENGRGSPPACGLNYNYVMLLLDPEDLLEGKTSQVVFTLRSTATKIARAMNTLIMNNGTWTDSILRIGIQSTSNTKGTFFIPTVEYWGENGGKTRLNAERIAERLVGTSIRSSLEASDDDA